MNEINELFKWLSDICKTSSWIGTAILSYFKVPNHGDKFIIGTIVYFLGMQLIAFKLHLKSLEDK